MSRRYGQIACSVWDDDDDFMQLSVGAQRVYLMLVTQRDISACGSLPLTMRRWAQRIRESEREMLSEWLEELVAARFVIVDQNSEELLIRTFIKWDNGYTNTKRVLAIHGASKALRSPILRAVLADEMGRLGLVPTFIVPETVSADEYPIDSPSDSPSDTCRVVVTSVSSSTTTHNPRTTTHNPQPATRNPAEDPDEQATRVEDEPRSKPIDLSVAKVARIYSDRVRPSDPAKISAHIVNASSDWDLTTIAKAVERLAGDRRTVTADTLRIELEALELPDKHGTIHYRDGATKDTTTGIVRNRHGQIIGGGGVNGKPLWYGS